MFNLIYLVYLGYWKLQLMRVDLKLDSGIYKVYFKLSQMSKKNCHKSVFGINISCNLHFILWLLWMSVI